MVHLQDKDENALRAEASLLWLTVRKENTNLKQIIKHVTFLRSVPCQSRWSSETETKAQLLWTGRSGAKWKWRRLEMSTKVHLLCCWFDILTHFHKHFSVDSEKRMLLYKINCNNDSQRWTLKFYLHVNEKLMHKNNSIIIKWLQNFQTQKSLEKLLDGDLKRHIFVLEFLLLC